MTGECFAVARDFDVGDDRHHRDNAAPVYGGGTIAYVFDDTRAASPGKYHTGIDHYGPGKKSTYILASNVGVVEKVVINGKNDHGLGNCLIIRHDVVINSKGKTFPYYTLYGHLDGITNGIKVGSKVKRGQIIGTMGSSGYGKATYWGRTPHLHFEVKLLDVLSNPTGSGTYYGYTPKPAGNYGYINPANVIGGWTAK